jgi:hypothetical protein
MKRVRIEKPKPRRERWWLEVLPLDPRDPDVVRAKAIDRSGDRRTGVTRK